MPDSPRCSNRSISSVTPALGDRDDKALSAGTAPLAVMARSTPSQKEATSSRSGVSVSHPAATSLGRVVVASQRATAVVLPQPGPAASTVTR